MGFSGNRDRFPVRGERVATWVESYLASARSDVGTLAFQANVDKRDLRRLIVERSCGHRLEDALAAFFGWDFIEAVMTPVVGADPLTAREAELEARLAEAAALHERVAREHAARKGDAPRPAVRLVAGREPRSFAPSVRGA